MEDDPKGDTQWDSVLEKDERNHDDRLGRIEAMRLSAAQAYYSLSGTLGLGRLTRVYRQARIDPSSPLWLLGFKYNSIQEEHLQSFPYMTYRKGFAPLMHGYGLTSDAGWGCTLRVSQMLVASSIYTSTSDWQERERVFSDTMRKAASTTMEAFWDVDDDERHPLSIHSIIRHGRKFGVIPGRWMGPHVASKSISEAINYSTLPIRAHVIGCGGGAPVLYTEPLKQTFATYFSQEHVAGVLILIPLVMGIGKINPVYIPQVTSLLEIEQSVGIIGGSSHSSYYFIGHQNDTLLYLDPHMVQPAALNKDSVTTFSSSTMQSMPASSMDSSASFGFLCRHEEDVDRLMSSLATIEQSYEQYPIMCVRREGSEPPSNVEGRISIDDEGLSRVDSDGSSSSWELV